MNDWKSEFLSQVLADIPPNYPARWYRDRLAGELSGHLDALEEELEAGGLSPDAARARALEKMGDPGELRRKFRDEFRRREAHDPFRCTGALFMGCFIAFVCCILSYFAWAMADYLLHFITPHHAAVYRFLSWFPGVVMPVLPPVIGAAYLRWAFRYHEHPGYMVTLGLLLSWLGWEFCRIEISALLEGISFGRMAGWMLDDLLRGEPGAVCQVCLLPLCFVLGRLFGRPGGRDRRRNGAEGAQ